jgi:hypothetical protein
MGGAVSLILTGLSFFYCNNEPSLICIFFSFPTLPLLPLVPLTINVSNDFFLGTILIGTMVIWSIVGSVVGQILDNISRKKS